MNLTDYKLPFFAKIALPILALLAIPAFALNKISLHTFFNAWNHASFDKVFFTTNYIGEGITAAFFAVLLLFYSWKSGLFIALSAAGSGLITQLLKRFVFADFKRPAAFMEQMQELQIPAFVKLHYAHSFPSGHATTAFALCCALSLVLKKRGLTLVFVFLAFIGAYSRVYLSQHFFMDIVVGGIIGTLFTCVLHVFLKTKFPKISI
jgi:membrane-associated phospholipid phosphatase